MRSIFFLLLFLLLTIEGGYSQEKSSARIEIGDFLNKYIKKEEPPQVKEDISPAKREGPAYRISPGDALKISVYGEPDLEKVVRVSEVGKIDYPLIGEVIVEGFTAEGLARKIERLLSEGFLVNPQVSVFIQQYTNFFVLGAVKKEGGYELKGPLTLVDALALAGGTTEHADLTRIKVIRKYGGEEKEYLLDLKTEGGNFLLKPFDRIRVEEYGQISIFGQVKKPGSYYLKKNLTVVEAIALAGGFTDIANQNGVRVIRKGKWQEEVIKVPVGSILRSGDKSQDVLLKEKDTVVVPESFF